MFRIDPDGLYTRQDLKDLFAPAGVDADALVRRIRPAKRLRLLWLGSDLLDALRNAPPIGADAPADADPAPMPRRPGRARRTADGGEGVGIFSRRELGLD